jgi:hypothetical protein
VILVKLGWIENHLARRFAEVTEPLDTELTNYKYGVMRVRLKAPLFYVIGAEPGCSSTSRKSENLGGGPLY